MKNSTFFIIICWTIIWSLITINYFSTIKLGISDIVQFLTNHGFELLVLFYGITGMVVNYLIIREEFRLRNKIKQLSLK
jgi:hypothetical protein